MEITQFFENRVEWKNEWGIFGTKYFSFSMKIGFPERTLLNTKSFEFFENKKLRLQAATKRTSLYISIFLNSLFHLEKRQIFANIIKSNSPA